MITALIAATLIKPNVVILFTDDAGYGDFGFTGSTQIATPNIDRIAEEGMTFTRAYVPGSVCSPSRAGLLTGKSPASIGHEYNLGKQPFDDPEYYGLPLEHKTIADYLKAEGYRTGLIGKWHLGFAEPFLPKNQGFDHYFGLLHNLDPVEVVYFDDRGGVPLMRNDDVVKRPADPAE